MDFLTSKKVITILLAFLVILNVTLLGFVWWQNTNRPMPKETTLGHHDRQLSLGRQLALNESQSISFDKLRKEHFLEVGPEIQAIALLKKQLIDASLQERIDTTKIAALSENIGSRQASIEKKLALHFHELAKVCTPAQRDSLKTILERIGTRRHRHSREQ
jgi:Spy/CpxP family protein refolding chaperone